MYTTRIKVNLSVIISVETDQPPSQVNPTEMDEMIVDNAANTIAQWNDPDLQAAITGHEVLATERS